MRFLSNQLSLNNKKHEHGILESRSFKQAIESQHGMLCCWGNANQSFGDQIPWLRILPKNLSKSLIFLKRRGGEKFIPWFFDVLGPTHHLISKLKNVYIFLSIFNLDILLKSVSWWKMISSFQRFLFFYSIFSKPRF